LHAVRAENPPGRDGLRECAGERRRISVLQFLMRIHVNLSLGAKAIALFGLSVLFLVLLTLFESLLSGTSLTAEKAISALLLVLPGVIGVAFGILSIFRKESRLWMAILGILLNGLFALFHIFVISFAG